MRAARVRRRRLLPPVPVYFHARRLCFFCSFVRSFRKKPKPRAPHANKRCSFGIDGLRTRRRLRRRRRCVIRANSFELGHAAIAAAAFCMRCSCNARGDALRRKSDHRPGKHVSQVAGLFFANRNRERRINQLDCSDDQTHIRRTNFTRPTVSAGSSLLQSFVLSTSRCQAAF